VLQFWQQVVNGLVNGADYILLALGLTLVFGVLRVVNFAHGEYFMLGGLAGYVATGPLGLPYAVAVPVALLVGAVGGMVTDVAFVRPLRGKSEEAVFISTFGLSFILLYGVDLSLGDSERSVNGAATGSLHLGGLVIENQQLVTVGMVIVAVGLVVALLRATRIGAQIRAVAQDPYAAELIGIKVGRVYSATFAIGGALGALAGVAISPLTSVDPFTGQTELITAFVIVVAGGMGSMAGTSIVAICLAIAEAMANTYLPSGDGNYVVYVFLILVLLLRPNGLFSSSARGALAGSTSVAAGG
jgi:branched-chain amino acid transport system permease protein